MKRHLRRWFSPVVGDFGRRAFRGWCGLAVALCTVCGASLTAAADAPPTQRDVVKRAMQQRPGDPWPRGLAHVLLATPGSQQPEKAYHEPGGSFSPAVGSFGLAIWVRDANSTLQTTSDALPLADIRQQFSWPDPAAPPAIVTATPHYAATWAYTAPGNAALELVPRGAPQERLELVVRSVGPAGGPITNIAWDGAVCGSTTRGP